MSEGLLAVEDLVKHYGATRALDGVSLEVERGELFGLLGPNGAGKTTLLSILAGLMVPTSGQVTLRGEPLIGNRALRPLMGLVPQEIAVYPDLTGRENLRFFGELYGMKGRGLAEQTEVVLAAVGLIEKADHRAKTYSGGMLRRLNLGVGMIHRPQILLLDEPTVGVDPQSRNHIFEQVRRLNAEGVTIIYTSHYIEEVQALCTRIGIIDHGKLIACDTLAGLLSRIKGRIELRMERTSEAMLDAFRQLPDVEVLSRTDSEIVLECGAVKSSLIHVAGVLKDQQVELLGLEAVEPNLEQVFLQLTEKTLRD